MSTFKEQWTQLLAPNRKTGTGMKLDTLDAVRNPFLVECFCMFAAHTSISIRISRIK